jgi:CRP-like cAMP-binding protein
MVTHEQFQANEILFNQGDHGDKLYIIIKGSVEVIYNLGNVNIVISSLYDGQYFGELSLMDTKKTQDYSDALENLKIKTLDQTRDYLYKKMMETWDKQERYICAKALQAYELKNGPIPQREITETNDSMDPGGNSNH